jgi:glycosyltransferase involved in cell wall biosynthesis
MNTYTIVTGDFVRTGGMDVANYHLARHLALAGHAVHLVAHRAAPDLLTMPGVQWHRVAKPFNSYLLGRGALRRAGRRWGEVAHAHGGNVIVNGGNCVSVDLNWVHYVHAGHAPSPGSSLRQRAMSGWTYRRFVAEEREAVPAARVVVANSNRTKRDLVEGLALRPMQVHTVYYGTDGEYHRPPSAEEREAARRALGLNDERPTVAFVGALGDRRKGFDTLFSAWRELRRDRRWDVRLAVVGAGRELGAWRSRTASAGLTRHIQFLGFTRDVRRVLWACDAVVAPARYEAYGLAVHEAVACGLPAIVNSEAGVAERLGGLSGLHPERAGDAAALADALRRWADGRQRWAAAAAEISRQLRAWSWDDMGARIVQLLEARS